MKDFMEEQLWLAPWHVLIWVVNRGGGERFKNDPVYWLIFLYIMMIMTTKARSRKVHIVRGQLRNNTLAVGTDD